MEPSHKSHPDKDPGTVQVTKPTGNEYGFIVSCAAGIMAHEFPSTGQVVLGRGEECDISVLDDSVSRRHAVVHAGDPPTIEDLGSTNGTRLASRLIAKGTRHPLTLGTVVELGSATLVVQRGRPAIVSAMARTASPTVMPPAPGPGAGSGVVRDPTMLQLYQLLDVIAPSPITVLILGETGVGKEVFAEAIHQRSPRAGKPFLRLNCAALPDSILESELFGHERGSFTGAMQTKQGLLESAESGTVFLDEVGELPLVTQAKLLRFLESGEVMRVGALKPRKIDVRLVAATNRDLQSFIATGQFRADLFFRLNGISVTLPPLRKRPKDIEPLLRMFVERASARLGRPAPVVAPDALAALMEYSWPGNIRELRNVVERAVVLCREGRLERLNLLLPEEPARHSEPAIARPSPVDQTLEFRAVETTSVINRLDERASSGALSEPRVGVTKNLLEEVEHLQKERILDALEKCAGNQSRAAKVLGISRRMLITRLDTYGISRPRKGRPDEE